MPFPFLGKKRPEPGADSLSVTTNARTFGKGLLVSFGRYARGERVTVSLPYTDWDAPINSKTKYSSEVFDREQLDEFITHLQKLRDKLPEVKRCEHCNSRLN